jgi:hypothetical protein
MAFAFSLEDLLAYSDWDRAQWHGWFRDQGPDALAVGLGANGDGRFANVGELVRHIFSAEQRYVELFGKRTLTVTPRKMMLQAVTHELRHWAQIATFLRLAGRRQVASAPARAH